MWLESPVLYIIALLAGVWMAVSRETRVAAHGYLVQTGAVAVLYLAAAVQTGDIGVWLDLLGLVALRLVLIPWLLRKFLRGDLYNGRHTSEIVSPPYALTFYVFLSALGLGVGDRLGYGATGINFGLAVAVLLIGLTSIAISHHTPKQIIGVLAADNGADLGIVLTISRISLIADYVVFLDVVLAALCLALLVIRLRQFGTAHSHDFSELRG